MNWYTVLTEDNIKELAEKSGRPEKELNEMYQQGYVLDAIWVFWKEPTGWRATRIHKQIITQIGLDEIMNTVAGL